MAKYFRLYERRKKPKQKILFEILNGHNEEV